MVIISSAGQIKDQIISVGKQLIDYGLVLATWGNISCRVPKTDLFLVTPSGIPYSELQPSDLVQLDLTGEYIEGTRIPSSESLVHLAIYKKRPDVQAIVHTHSNYASMFAVVRENIPPILVDMAQMIGGPIKVAKYALSGTQELALNTVEALEDRNAVLLANHGVITTGSNLDEAFNISLLVEKCAQVLLGAKNLGSPFILDTKDTLELREEYLHYYGQKSREE
ncbi:MAG: class II aldolase/adducin family protein [Bacillota bacterium]|jgi:L-fuculose-phosphate aldolase